MKVMLGGPIFGIENYEPASFGADAICTDAKTAVGIAKTILAKAA
jgi:methanogenic corrinoid protein MtbC1